MPDHPIEYEHLPFPDDFAAGYCIASEYDPNDHLMSLKGKAYLDVQQRLVWFVRDQRRAIAQGIALVPSVIRQEKVAHDPTGGPKGTGFAEYSCFIRDCFGNEAQAYGSETAVDFGDYLEKAGTKATGRALALLGYGTQHAPELVELPRIVDSPGVMSAVRAPAIPLDIAL